MQRKSGFLTFCFACLPGVGEMYLGYMKRGLSVMIAFWGLILSLIHISEPTRRVVI